jgi:pyruvate dehydrogenase E1 component
MGNQTREKLRTFAATAARKAYPSRTKDIDDVDFSTGSVGLGVAITAFASMIQDYIAAKPWSSVKPPLGRMIALVGDAELDEGNIYECLQEGWKHDLRNTWWIIDYNRQSLDGVVREGLWQRIEGIFTAFGWDVVRLKYGALQRAAFEEPGGDALRDWIDNCPNQLYSALTFQGGAAWRQRLLDEIGDQGDVTALIEKPLRRRAGRADEQSRRPLRRNADAGLRRDRPRPADLLSRLHHQGVGHAACRSQGQPRRPDDQGTIGRTFQAVMGVAEGQEWEPLRRVDRRTGGLKAFLKRCRSSRRAPGATTMPSVAVPAVAAPDDREISTQAAFGKILDDSPGPTANSPSALSRPPPGCDRLHQPRGHG